MFSLIATHSLDALCIPPTLPPLHIRPYAHCTRWSAQPLAQALVEVLKRADPPVCVGLYARWGAGKTFMISLLKEEFDKTVREDPHTRQLLQFFEDGYEKLESKNAYDPESHNVDPTVCSSSFLDLLHTILSEVLSFFLAVLRGMHYFLPYGMTTLFSIVCDALYACWPKAMAETTDSSCFYRLFQDDPEQVEEKIKKEFIFVHFNAWECAACLSSLGPTNISFTSHIDGCPDLPNLIRCGLGSCEVCTRRWNRELPTEGLGSGMSRTSSANGE